MTGSDPSKIGGILLAAGGSSRMMQPKQLLQFRGKTLLRRAAESMAESSSDPAVVVFGSGHEAARKEISGLPLTACINKNWESGMSSSIKAGLHELLRIEPNLAAVVITLCDQPFVTSSKIDLLVEEFRNSASPIVAAEYNGTIGVPALFSRAMFDKLKRLEGDKGARNLIRTRLARVRTIKMEEAAFDIDTPGDIAHLTSD